MIIAQLDIAFWGDLVSEVGPVLAILGYLLYQDCQRRKQDVREKDAMGVRIDTLDTYQRETLETLVGTNAEIVTDNSAAIREQTLVALDCKTTIGDNVTTMKEVVIAMQKCNGNS